MIFGDHRSGEACLPLALTKMKRWMVLAAAGFFIVTCMWSYMMLERVNVDRSDGVSPNNLQVRHQETLMVSFAVKALPDANISTDLSAVGCILHVACHHVVEPVSSFKKKE